MNSRARAVEAPSSPIEAAVQAFQAMGEIQQQGVQAALARRLAALKQLKAPVDPVQLFTLQGELLQQDAVQAAQYWQQMAAAALEAQSELAASCTRLIDTESVFGPAATFGH